MEFRIGVRGPKCLNDGATRWSKKFSDRFSRFDTIPAVTDTQPASQPASHVAVAITLNAKASSLKTRGKSPFISETVRDRPIYGSLIGSHWYLISYVCHSMTILVTSKGGMRGAQIFSGKPSYICSHPQTYK